jgi:glutamyl-tRNA reductase
VNRSLERAKELAERTIGHFAPWEQLLPLVAKADLIVSTTGASQPIVSNADFERIAPQRAERPLFILDLAVPRDFDPAIGNRAGVYLYSVDDLQAACDRNRAARAKQWPKAERIINDEARRFMAELHHRSTGPTIRRLTALAGELKQQEVARLFNKLGELDSRQRDEIQRSFDRLVNKLLHPPLESLRDEAATGSPHSLIEALRRLFKLP